ncbi:MAG: four helix bundle protein [Candidatus Goldiibacteriota bacterium]
MNFKELDIWKKGLEIDMLVSKVTLSFPKRYVYSLCSQMERASISISSNISEGHSKKYTGEFIKHLYYAYGSCAELETQITMASHREIIDPKIKNKLLKLLEDEQKMISSLINKLKKKMLSQKAVLCQN